MTSDLPPFLSKFYENIFLTPTVLVKVHTISNFSVSYLIEKEFSKHKRVNSGMVEVLVCCLSLYTEYLSCEAQEQIVYQPSMVPASSPSSPPS